MPLQQTLIEKLQSGRLIPFVGAGVSRAVVSNATGVALFPSWKELLFRAADRLAAESKPQVADLVRALLSIPAPDYLQAASRAREALGPTWFPFLKEQFDFQSEVAQPSSLELARAIWRLGSNLVITTNFDPVLRWTTPAPADLTTWDITAPAEQATLLRNGITRPTIWHLHGTIDNASNIVLTPDSYQTLYSSPDSESRHTAAKYTLRSLLVTHSFLFIGFSLQDEPFGMQIRAASAAYSGAAGPHYALVHSDSAAAIENQHLPGIEIVPFHDYGQPVVDLIDELRERSCTPAFSTTAAKQPSSSGRVPQSVLLDVKPPQTAAKAVFFDDNCDTPPPTSDWVGRNDKLQLMNTSDANVIAITGIGGQGKTTLVAKHLLDNAPGYTLWDWRDCKEETNTLHTQLIRAIERITAGQYLARDLSGESIDSVVRLFLTVANPLNALFVFDNIDKYIDVTTYQAVDGMHTLILGALRLQGKARFAFTARPRLMYDSAKFLSIELPGLSLGDAADLFAKRQVEVPQSFLLEIHELTTGHPLWMTLIATQIFKQPHDIRGLLTRIKSGSGAGLPNAMLREVWDGLTERQAKLLRYMAEAVRPETEDQLSDYVSSGMNRNRFDTALRQLVAVDLVIVKSPPKSPMTYELHPLVREFVRQRFTRSERTPFISVLIKSVKSVIERFRPRLATQVPYSVLHHWIVEVELLINSGNASDAMVFLFEAADPLVRAGYSEEFIRLAIDVLAIIDFETSPLAESSLFEDTCAALAKVMSTFGRFEDAEEHIKKFESASKATARYVLVCDMWTWHYWSRKDFDRAKDWGARGVAAKTTSHVDTRHDCSHNLALAQRDSGDVDSALTYFLHGETLDSVLGAKGKKVVPDNERGPFYGNIGRTLFLKEMYPEARVCLLKSARFLENERVFDDALNRGWAAYWLGELCLKTNDVQTAYTCFRRADILWRRCSPFRAEEALAAANSIADHAGSVIRSDDWAIEKEFLHLIK